MYLVSNHTKSFNVDSLEEDDPCIFSKKYMDRLEILLENYINAFNENKFNKNVSNEILSKNKFAVLHSLYEVEKHIESFDDGFYTRKILNIDEYKNKMTHVISLFVDVAKLSHHDINVLTDAMCSTRGFYGFEDHHFLGVQNFSL